MSYALYVPVKEEVSYLKSCLKKSSLLMHPRLKMLICMKEAGEKGISKKALVAYLGVSDQSIQTWRTSYKTGGLALLLSHKKKGACGKPSIFSVQEHERLEQKLKDPGNGLSGYVELQAWIAQEFGKEVKYNTVLKYARRHFGTRVKVARKSHVKKDEQAVEDFKKTLSKT